MESELVIKLVMSALVLGTVFGAYIGYWLRGPKVARLKQELAALRQKLDAVQGALE